MGLMTKATANANLEQFIFGFGRHRAASDRRAGTEAIGTTDLARVRRDAGMDGRFAQVQLAIENRVIAADRVRQRSEELEDAENRNQAGTVSKVDVRTTAIEVENARNGLRDAEAQIAQAMAELRRALGFDNTGPLLTVEDPLQRPADIERLLNAATANLAAGPEIDQQMAIALLETGNADDATATLYPQLFGVGRAGYLEAGPTDDDDFDWSVGLSLRWSLYSGGVQYAQARAAESRVAQAQANRLQIIQQRAAAMEQIREQLRSLADRIERQQRIVTLTDENYADARLQYQEGIITQTTLGDISLQVSEAKFGLASLIF